MGLGVGVTTPHLKNLACLNSYASLSFGLIFGKTCIWHMEYEEAVYVARGLARYRLDLVGV